MARPPKITNEEILAAARQVFLEQGVGASTLEIAEKAGISEASIFKRFATKQRLFMEAIGIFETPKWAKLLATQTPTENIRQELTDICVQMLGFYLETLPRVLMMMNQAKVAIPPPMPPPPLRDSQLLAKFIDRAIAKGYIRSCDAVTVGQMIAGGIMLYVLTESGIAGKLPIPIPFMKLKPVEPSVFIDNLIGTLWLGLAPKD
jgi:AcrR family transcriptional regulator